MKRPGWFLLMSALIVGPASAGPPSAKNIDVEKTSAALTLSKRVRTPNGYHEDWTINLYPNGRFAFKGTHAPAAPGSCSAKAGRFERSLPHDRHSELVALALRAAEEQRGLKPATEDRSPHALHFSLHTELGERSETTEIFNPDASETKKFLEAALATANELQTLKAGAMEALSIQAKGGPKKGTVAVTIRNIGFFKTNVVLPEEASEAFQLRTGSVKTRLDYARDTEERTEVLEPGKSLEVELKLPRNELPRGAVLLYDNQAIKHHAEGGRASTMSVALCTGLEGGAQ